ncbi:MAG: glucuronyl hydrolase, partial [Dysgonomonas sp.]|nr:glucuronyl hydrolase [Dysgonomonas sp.]
MNRLLILILTTIFIVSCDNKKDSQKEIIQSDFDFAASQLTFAMAEVDKSIAGESVESREKREKKGHGPLVSPRSIDEEGNLILVPSRDWTSGFFPGELWYMYEYTKDPKWEQAARKYTAPIEREKINGITHDMGFKVYCSFGNGYRLTKDEKYKEILLESAYTLTTRYKPNAKIIRSWEHSRDKWDCPVIIDN